MQEDTPNDSELLREQIASLTADNERLARQAATDRRRHTEDIARIGQSLMDEAQRRNWCNDYDDFVNSLNDYLHESLPSRERDYVIVQTYTITRSRVVSAVDADNVSSVYDDYDTFDSLDSDGWEVVDCDHMSTDIELAD